MILTERFDSLSEFTKMINSRKVNKAFKKRAYLASEDDNEEFRKTKNYQEAEDLLNSGYSEGCENLANINMKNFHGETIQRNTFTTDVIGFVPIVPNCIMGIPTNMLNSKLQPRKTPVMRVYYSASVCASVKADDIILAAKKILGAVQAAERNKIRVELHILNELIIRESGDIILCSVKIKEFRQPLDILKIAYPLVHPSMCRRHFFHWLETFPELKKYEHTLVENYGIPLYKIKNEKLAKDARDDFFGKDKDSSVYLNFDKVFNATEDTLTRMFCGAKI